ncbi:MAG: chemotaxis protein CheW [Oscillospiraceae bacterium]|nr:chemotaxis protein CheW [Oscillospiraceae bacterium]
MQSDTKEISAAEEQTESDFYGEEEQNGKDYPWIVFSLDGVEYGVNSKFVLSIEILGEITPIADTHACCPGITRSRGDMIELLDLRALFGMGGYRFTASDGADVRQMMVVIETDGVKRGVIVDRVVSVEYVAQFIDSAVNAGKGGISSKYISRIAKREKAAGPLLIIDTESLSAR